MERGRTFAEIIVGVIIGSVIGLLCTLVIVLLQEQPALVIDPKISIFGVISLILTSIIGIYIAVNINRQNIMFSDALSKQQGITKAQRDDIGDYCKSIRRALEIHQDKMDTFYDTVLEKINNSTAPNPNPSKEDLSRFIEDNLSPRIAKMADILIDFKVLRYESYDIAVEPDNPIYIAYIQARDVSTLYFTNLFKGADRPNDGEPKNDNQPKNDIDFDTITAEDLKAIRKRSRSEYHNADITILLFKTAINRYDKIS